MYPSRHASAPESTRRQVDLSTTDSRLNELHSAAEAGDTDIVQLLLECGVGVNSEVPSGGTALHVAAREGNLDTVKLLVKHNIIMDKLFEGRGTALHTAAEEGHLDVVEFLLDNGADVEARSVGGETALAKAIHQGQLDIVRLLLDHGAAQLVRVEDNLTALHEASMAEDPDIVRLLIAYGADMDAVDDEGRSALYFAAQCGETEIVRVLLESGAKVNINESTPGPRPLPIAAANGHFEAVRLFLDYGAAARMVRLDARLSVLHDATQVGETRIVKLLLEQRPRLLWNGFTLHAQVLHFLKPRDSGNFARSWCRLRSSRPRWALRNADSADEERWWRRYVESATPTSGSLSGSFLLYNEGAGEGSGGI